MVFYFAEKLGRGHLERDGNVAIGIDHDDVIFFIDGVQIRPSVVFGDAHIVRFIEISGGKVDDFAVDLNALDIEIVKAALALRGIGSASVSENENADRGRIGIRSRCVTVAGSRTIDPVKPSALR